MKGEGLHLLHLSDIHLWYSTRVLDYLKKVIMRTTPDLLVLTGDYYDLPRGAQNFRAFLTDISAQQKVIFIRGNHDTLYGKRVTNLLSGISNCTDVDEAVYRFVCNDRHFFFTSWKNKHHLPSDGQGVNIVLIHNPEQIRKSELENIDLILAGHLHGGQFRFFKMKDNSHFPGNLLYRYCTDRTEIGKTTLIVNRGIGDTFPIRFNCPKELVHITLQ